MKRVFTILAVAVTALAAGRAHAAIQITEWMYSGIPGEYIEFTNTGATPVDLTGWSFTDSIRTIGQVPLAPLGTVAAGESFIITESPAATFRTAWELAPSVKVLGDNIVNLGRSDEINIYNGTTLSDRLTFDDQGIVGSIRTQNKGGVPSSPAALGAQNVLLWQLAAVGDGFGSKATADGNIGNPGMFTQVPEPASLALAGLGAVAIATLRRRSR
jgi:hypothetical protein